MKYHTLQLMIPSIVAQFTILFFFVPSLAISSTTSTAILGVLVSQFFLVLVFIASYSHFIGRKLDCLRMVIKSISADQKDLTIKTGVRGMDQVGQLCQEFDQLITSFDETLIRISGSAHRLKPMALELSDMNMGLSQKNQVQYSLSRTTSAELAEASTSSAQVSQCIQGIVKKVEESESAISSGEVVVNSLFTRIELLAAEMEETSNSTQSLKETTHDVNGIVGMIGQIAEQTNLLALNAAIEAARAGDSGRGFAVVADEVRALSIKTQESTSLIENKVEKMRAATNLVLEKMFAAKEALGIGVNEMQDAKACFAETFIRVKDIASNSVNILDVLAHQNDSLQKVVATNNSITGLNQDILEFTKTSAVSEKDLVKLGQFLLNYVNEFKLSQKEFDTALRDRKNRALADNALQTDSSPLDDNRDAANGEVELF